MPGSSPARRPPGELRDLVQNPVWDPDLFVKLCTGRPDSAALAALLAIQRREMELLFEHDFAQAFGRRE